VEAAIRLEFEQARLEWVHARSGQVRRRDAVAAARVETCQTRLDALLDLWNAARASRALP
jgi:hypothetical protein